MSIIQRPIQKLIPLEFTKRNTQVLPNVNNNFNENSLNESLPKVNKNKHVQRPKKNSCSQSLCKNQIRTSEEEEKIY